MRDYGKIAPTFWTGKTGRAIRARGSEGVIVALYLMTSPHSNMLGLYYQPNLYMAHETGLGIEGASKGLQDCIDAGFCAFDPASEMVWVYEMASYQIANELKAGDKRCTGIQREYDALPDCTFLGEFFDKYKAAFHLRNRRSLEGASQGPSKPLRSQEQEQEQEQKQEITPPNPPTGGCTGTMTEKKAKVRAARMTLQTFLANCRTAGEKPISDYEPLTRYMAESGLPTEFVNLCWAEFKRQFLPGGKGERKQQALWRRHFQNFVEGNFLKLWYAKPSGDGVVYELTTVGLQAQIAQQRREAA